MNGIYEDISYNKNNTYLEKVRLFFDIKEHSIDTLRYTPHSVFDEYLKMYLKDEITYDDVYKAIEMDYRNSSNNGSGLSTNVFQYLSYYIDVKKLNKPRHIRHESGRWKDFDYTELVKKSMDEIFDTRDGKIFLLAGITKEETV